jgi:endonuclease/exonuclease/phosphatase family metal-dependent hydrolase
MWKRLLSHGIAGSFGAVLFFPGVRRAVSSERFEAFFRRTCAKQKPLEGWPETMVLWERVRLLGRALEGNCVHRAPPQPVGLRVLRQPSDSTQPLVACASPTSRLRILSMNLWCSHFLGGSNRAARLQLLVQHLDEEHYDLLCFQELFTFGLGPTRLHAECQWLGQQLHKRGYAYSTVVPVAASSPWVGQDAGLAAFSRLPLEDVEVVRFSNCRALSQKGVLRLRVTTEHGPVDVHATHLEHSDQTKQATQVAEITDGIPRPGCTAGRTLVLGDMNICASRFRGPMYDLLSGAMGNKGLATNLSAGLAWTCDLSMARAPLSHPLHLLSEYPATSGSQTPEFGCTIDHCWMAPELAKNAHCSVVQLVGSNSEGGEFTASDHLGMVFEIELGGSGK